MESMTQLPALPIAVPLVVAAVLAAGRDWWPRPVADWLAVATALFTTLVTGKLLAIALVHPIVYWMGGWQPRAGVAIGVSLSIDALGAGTALLASTLVTAAFVFAIKYFDSVGTLFHVLMLIFLAGMCGFALTGDLFNLFVWFEVMGAAAYALCGYKTEDPKPLQGALNFAVTNTVGAFLALIGVAMLYGRTGALNMAQIGRSLTASGRSGPDGLVLAAFAFITCGFLVKAAVVPFHFWLDDAHAVAPTPVCILFSGVMVELGLYGAARVYWAIFAGVLGPHAVRLRAMLMAFAVLTALVGGAMSFAQQNLKRLLAFSTVSHMGIMMMGVASLTAPALAATAFYALGHGAVKAALFCFSGILLHRFGSVDAVALRGRGRAMPITGVFFALGALLLASLPPSGIFMGDAMLGEAARPIGYQWIMAIASLAAALTGGAVLRAGARVFLGWGEKVAEREKEIKEERETSGASAGTPRVMSVTAGVLVLIAMMLGLTPAVRTGAARAARQMTNTSAYQASVLDHAVLPAPQSAAGHVAASETIRSAVTVSAAVIFAAWGLLLPFLPWQIRQTAHRFSQTLQPLRRLHSGHIGDYVVWFTFGVAALGGLLTLALR